jgi:hypothetical protein
MTIYTQPALRQTSRLGATVARAAQDAIGVTAGRKRIAREAYGLAFYWLVKDEDANGVESGAWVSDNLTRDRQAAMRIGLLTAGDVSNAERAAVARADAERAA